LLDRGAAIRYHPADNASISVGKMSGEAGANDPEQASRARSHQQFGL